MLKKGLLVTAFLAMQLLITGCAQEKVMDTEFIRLQNKVKDLETAQKQRDDQLADMSQRMSTMETQLTSQADLLGKLAENTKQDAASSEVKFPVVIQDVKLTSEKMDAQGRIWGPFSLSVTLYNGTDRVIMDNLSAIMMEDHPESRSEIPKIQNYVQKFEIKPNESKVITFSNLPVNQPSKRLNVIVKLLEQTRSEKGTPGKATWVVVPTVISEP
ncbi:hypothetical protein [Ammoniphilus sp. YIM 78166]|uniref:hypothetical protein n=1 Tax=Ammoniphilus sp. YIM 78166 TaxID=1644106 RepID=UPI00107030CA|nr:hypothetical protein [Ammoniphilus sp. YIM 78166]